MAGEENTGMESYTKESGGYREIEKYANNINGRSYKWHRCYRRVNIDPRESHGDQRADQSSHRHRTNNCHAYRYGRCCCSTPQKPSDTFNQYFIVIGSYFYQSFKKHLVKKEFLISRPVLREVEGLLPLQFCLKSVPVSH